MKFLEKDLEDIIWETDNEILNYHGLGISGKKFRQVKIGNYGIADLITIDRDYKDSMLYITVYELKKDKVGISALLQALSYRRGIERFIEKKRNLFSGNSFRTEIVLIGYEIDKSGSFPYLGQYSGIDFYTYDFDVDGISFEIQYGYYLHEEGF